MKTTKELLKEAKDSGCVTAADMTHWIDGYVVGVKSGAEEMIESLDKSDDDFYHGKATDQSQNFDSKEINSYMEV